MDTLHYIIDGYAIALENDQDGPSPETLRAWAAEIRRRNDVAAEIPGLVPTSWFDPLMDCLGSLHRQTGTVKRINTLLVRLNGRMREAVEKLNVPDGLMLIAQPDDGGGSTTHQGDTP